MEEAHGNHEPVVEETEIRRRFRLRGQPIRLFGESNRDRLHRLKQVESSSRVESGSGQSNLYRLVSSLLVFHYHHYYSILILLLLLLLFWI